MSVPVSTCTLVCDEAEELRRCLAALAWAEERVVVVDAKSRDESEAVARDAGAKVVVHPYDGDVRQRTFALAQCSRPWVLSVDADEVVTPALARAVAEAVADPGGCDAFRVNRVTFHLGRWIRHGDFFPDWQLRLFRREAARWVGRDPHGRAEVPGPVGRLKGELEHYSYRNLAEHVQRSQDFSRIQARALWENGRRARARDWLLRPPFRFLRAYLLRQGFRDGFPGLTIAVVTALYVFLKYAKLWELEHVGAQAEATRSDGWSCAARPGHPEP